MRFNELDNLMVIMTITRVSQKNTFKRSSFYASSFAATAATRAAPSPLPSSDNINSNSRF